MSSATNRDIWFEILQYFRVSFEGGTAGDTQLKRQVIFSVALTCSALTEVALDELWMSMTTLEPVVRVFNASPDSPIDGFKYRDDREDHVNGRYYWVRVNHLVALSIALSTLFRRRVSIFPRAKSFLACLESTSIYTGSVTCGSRSSLVRESIHYGRHCRA
ncbi:hypothetical protein P691DRAFT_170107 [Macrolepiota fuliginosa MF-IS2]|uniref:Uncharacterized protein n=1 Tax=Macrolepiota fuliginosa MF-IS2 TaxID=1400762 RepID=A0A9P5WX73_9AGAR|nr:hypothetical protein P691DRAFT_170107 [Macrolepiota fuliginosa MF-IS2]